MGEYSSTLSPLSSSHSLCLFSSPLFYSPLLFLSLSSLSLLILPPAPHRPAVKLPLLVAILIPTNRYNFVAGSHPPHPPLTTIQVVPPSLFPPLFPFPFPFPFPLPFSLPFSFPFPFPFKEYTT